MDSSAWSPRARADQEKAIGRCLELASEATSSADVPVGAVVFSAAGEVLGEGFNTRERDDDPAGHAEITALRAAAASLGSWRLDGCVLAVTLEPCPMCAGAVYQSRIGHVIFGAWDEKAGAAGSVFDILREPRLNHWVEVHPGVRAEECADQLRAFFEQFRR
ncbi:tRNA adenosine(34) deaminase TadA [Nesterenkonia sp. AY15]|uniref:tRNA adenosine(34) deaminase TadA n=1 Tax=Nesterenkonia sp. AY15 TaxID=2901139 RepID=UPI0031451747